MKSNAPWSVKGIERDARETAKEAARRHGMTVGEWLNQVIYTASDPESSDGEIEGLKTSDLVAAIEHLNKRAIGAESKSAAAIEDLARNFAGFVERLQRLERGRPAGAAVAGGPDIEARLERLEAKAGDRHRIDALKALEKAVTQVALQYDSAHKTSSARIASLEKQLQQLAARFDGGDAPSVSSLAETVETLAGRVERAERIASEAAALKAEARSSEDAGFVERTGARLRVLGDEIKRGGDQMRALEASIKKLSDQIDAAERRSAEGVEKVAETVFELSGRVGAGASAAGAEAGAAVEAARRAEEKVAGLQHAFEAMLTRLEAAGAAPLGGAVAPQAATPAAIPAAIDEEESDDEDEGDEAHAEIVGDEEEDEAFSAFDLDEEEDAEDDDEDAFEFDLDEEDEPAAMADKTAPLSGGGQAGDGSETDGDLLAPQAGLDAILAEFDRFETRDDADEAEAPEAPEADETEPQKTGIFGRRVAGETPARSDAAQRTLSPKQRAILAAKLRRRRLAEETLELKAPVKQPPAPAAPSAPVAARVAAEDDEAEDGEERPGMFAKAGAALGALRARLPGGSRKDKTEAASYGETRYAPPPREQASDPDITASARRAMRRVKIRPLTLALVGAVLLAAAALFFLVKDMLAGADAPTPPQRAAQAPTPRVVAPAPAAPAAPADEEPLTRPRELYFESVAKLRAATGDAAAREAIRGVEQAAALGHPPAQLQLAELYKLGQGVPQDQAQARTWYERAANGGNVLAMHRFGVMAARGQGGPVDQAAAIEWFRRAGDLGLVDSQYNLGALFYPGGDGANAAIQNAGEAYYWYSLARRNGDQQAGGLAESLLSMLSANQRREIDARVGAWSAGTPDAEANEIAPAS